MGGWTGHAPSGLLLQPPDAEPRRSQSHGQSRSQSHALARILRSVRTHRTRPKRAQVAPRPSSKHLHGRQMDPQALAVAVSDGLY